MTAPEPVEPAQDAASGSEINREAAKYRRALRDATGERDRLAGQLAALQRRDVLRLAAEHNLVKPEAIFSAGIELAQLIDDTGTVDPEKVSAAVHYAASTLGLAFHPNIRPDPSMGARDGAGTTTTWQAIFQDRKQP